MTSPLLDDVAPPLPASYAEDDREEAGIASRAWNRTVAGFRSALAALPSRRPPPPPPPPSGYLTLIPLSDSRLQPRDTRVTALTFFGFACAVATAVFLLVPRDITIGEIDVHAEKIAWNTTKHSYQLRLITEVPVYNPNFLQASIHGEFKVLYYKAEAGKATVGPIRLPPRVLPKTVLLNIDASDVPTEYILAILTQCSTFPEVLVFFLKGRLEARFLWQRQHLAHVDTYFMISCTDGSADVLTGAFLGRKLEVLTAGEGEATPERVVMRKGSTQTSGSGTQSFVMGLEGGSEDDTGQG